MFGNTPAKDTISSRYAYRSHKQAENFATHQNFSSLRIGNFKRKIDVDWQLPAYFEDKLKGFFTRKFFMSIKAYAYANIVAIVFRTDPVKYIGSGRPRNMASSLGDFDLSGDLKNLPHNEFAKLELIMKKYADQAIENALYHANLITNFKSRKVLFVQKETITIYNFFV
jgi:hypothetical protein